MTPNDKIKIITAPTIPELNEKVNKEIMEQGWQTDGGVIKNPDGTVSQKLVR